MPSRLDEVLRAGQAAATEPRRGRELWNGVAGNLTEFLPGDRRNDPSSPGMQDALRVAGEIEERNAELRARNAVALRTERNEHERMVREAARNREILREQRERLAESERQEQWRIKTYDNGNDDMKWIIYSAQQPIFTKMHDHLKTMKDSLTERYGSLMLQEADEAVGSNPSRALTIITLDDNLRQIDELVAGLVMLKSSVEDAKGYDYYDPIRTGLG
tara:strand:+ start:103 stop:756 length:654 start_codon:yes stop_codon:yes gene_type:complete